MSFPTCVIEPVRSYSTSPVQRARPDTSGFPRAVVATVVVVPRGVRSQRACTVPVRPSSAVTRKSPPRVRGDSAHSPGTSASPPARITSA